MDEPDEPEPAPLGVELLLDDELELELELELEPLLEDEPPDEGLVLPLPDEPLLPEPLEGGGLLGAVEPDDGLVGWPDWLGAGVVVGVVRATGEVVGVVRWPWTGAGGAGGAVTTVIAVRPGVSSAAGTFTVTGTTMVGAGSRDAAGAVGLTSAGFTAGSANPSAGLGVGFGVGEGAEARRFHERCRAMATISAKTMPMAAAAHRTFWIVWRHVRPTGVGGATGSSEPSSRTTASRGVRSWIEPSEVLVSPIVFTISSVTRSSPAAQSHHFALSEGMVRTIQTDAT